MKMSRKRGWLVVGVIVACSITYWVLLPLVAPVDNVQRKYKSGSLLYEVDVARGNLTVVVSNLASGPQELSGMGLYKHVRVHIVGAKAKQILHGAGFGEPTRLQPGESKSWSWRLDDTLEEYRPLLPRMGRVHVRVGKCPPFGPFTVALW